MRMTETLRALTLMCTLVILGCTTPGGEPEAMKEESRHTHTHGADPSINDRFDEPDVASFESRWESEDRDIFKRRHAILAASRIEPGQTVADIGAGTGLFVPLLADAVGEDGAVIAVDIVPEFLEHISERATRAGQSNVSTVLGTDHTVNLAPGSIDVAFVCATYHHFEYPGAMLAGIHKALRPGGTLIVVDFERVPGKSREWILGHVRAGETQVLREITSAGFQYDPSAQVDGLEENYFARFTRKP